MYVRVKYQDKKYYSYVFAHFEYDYMLHCVVFNNDENKFEIVSNLSKKSNGVRQIGYLNESEEGFIKKDGVVFESTGEKSIYQMNSLNDIINPWGYYNLTEPGAWGEYWG